MRRFGTFLCGVLFVLLNYPAFSQESGEVIITEIMYNPASSESNTQTQFIEIANTTANAVSLNNWTIDDEDADGPNTLPDVTLPPFGIAVICGCSTQDMQGAWGSGYTIISLLDLGQTMFNMANSPSATSEIIQLKDNLGNLVDEVNYDDASPWPSDSPDGVSIYLNLPNSSMNATANNNGSNWARSANGVDGAFNSTIFGVWNAVEQGSPGNVNGDQTLPVELAIFTAVAGDKRVTLKWVTQSEVDNVGFDIMKATQKNSEYSKIGFMEGRFTTNERTNYEFIDHLVSNGQTYWYKIIDIDVNGRRTEHGPVSATPQATPVEVTTINADLPTRFELYNNYPNPFNPETTLRFDIPLLRREKLAPVTVKIYNTIGQKIRTLFDGEVEPGVHELTWDGTTDQGVPAPAGVYYAIMKSSQVQQTIKMVLAK